MVLEKIEAYRYHLYIFKSNQMSSQAPTYTLAEGVCRVRIVADFQVTLSQMPPRLNAWAADQSEV
jgi:hypothetical protein